MKVRDSVFFIVFISGVFCDGCVKYTFEEDYENLFYNSDPPCTGLSFWQEQEYASIDMESPHNNSVKFVSPLPSPSCVSSFSFPMFAGGVVEVNVYMDGASVGDSLTVLASQIVVGGNDANIGTEALYPMDPNFVSGWQKLRVVTSSNLETFEGYVSFIGIQNTGSRVLVDSFRYRAPNFDEESCILYEDENRSTTPNPTTESVSDSSSPASTTESETDLPTTASTTESETDLPTSALTSEPETDLPTLGPTTESETDPPTLGSTTEPENDLPTLGPTTEPETDLPTLGPTTEPETDLPTLGPTTEPETDLPTLGPTTETETDLPTLGPTTEPETDLPTLGPTTETETDLPTLGPTTEPETDLPTLGPTTEPETDLPTLGPTTEPETDLPTLGPTTEPETDLPTLGPTTEPETVLPTLGPTTEPETDLPTLGPTTEPETDLPTLGPTTEPEVDLPTLAPTTPTETPVPEPSDFWSPLTITIGAVLCFIFLIAVGSVSYYFGWLNARTDEPEETEVDFENLPRPIKVPRVNRVYADVNFNPYRNP